MNDGHFGYDSNLLERTLDSNVMDSNVMAENILQFTKA
jgi:hypothetical protein